MKAGDVFRFIKGVDKHIRIVISDPEKHPGKVLVVNMTSYDTKEDQTCIVVAGEHSTATVPRSCIVYSRCNDKSSNEDLEKFVTHKLIQLYEPVSADLLIRIREGAIQSPRMPKEMKEILKQQGVV